MAFDCEKHKTNMEEWPEYCPECWAELKVQRVQLYNALKALMPLCDRDDVRDEWLEEFQKAEQIINQIEEGGKW